MRAQRLTRADYRRMRWRNGGGWTTEIARHPQGSDDDPFDWRVSIADIEASGDFSRFDGIDRTLLLLDGHGVELRVDSGNPVLLNTRGQTLAFGGEARVQCRLIDGATRDFNVFSRRSVLVHRAWFRPLVGPIVLFQESGTTWLVHVLSGRAVEQHRPQGVATGAGETLLIRPDASGRQLVLDGGGEAILVRISECSPSGTSDGATQGS